MNWIVFHTLSSIGSMVSGFKLRSLVYLVLYILHGDRQWNIFVLLHVTIQMDKLNLLKLMSFLQCIFFLHFWNSSVSSAWNYLLIVSSILMTSNTMFFYYICVTQFEMVSPFLYKHMNDILSGRNTSDLISYQMSSK